MNTLRLAVPLLLLSGCLIPRFPQDVETSFARGRMRTVETPHVRAYYPEAGRETALRTLARLEACTESLSTHPLSREQREKLQVFFTTSTFNNAYVQPRIGGLPQQMVLPQQLSLELFHLLGLAGGEVGDVSCHEAVHYVHMAEATGFWNVVNTVLGNVHQPNSFSDTWFLEGLATWYEARLGRRVGRPENPLWRGMFLSYASTHPLDAGHLNALHREHLPFGAHYVVGQHFVDWLARKYGEERLWALVAGQGDAVFSPLAFSVRFKQVFGQSVGAEFEFFAEDLRKNVTPRQRPATQSVRVASPAPYFARLAAAPNGSFALWSAALDDVNRLSVYAPGGELRWTRRLAEVLPGRRWISTNPLSVSGLSFSGDGTKLGFALADVTAVGNDATRLFVLDATTGEVLQEAGPFIGLGGSLSPDGSRFVAVEQDGALSQLVSVELATGARTPLTRFETPVTLGSPAFSPDGTRVAFSRWTGEGFDLWLLEPDGALRAVTSDGRFNYLPRWASDDALVFLRDTAGRAQPWRYTRSTGLLEQVGEVPWAALDPQPLPGGRVLLLNHEGAAFTVDELAPVPALATLAASPADLAPRPLPPPAPPAELSGDAPYSPWDNLLIPGLRVPFVGFSSVEGNIHPLYLLGLSGADRLGLHNYAATIQYVAGDPLPSVQLEYATWLAAPWLLSATGAFAYAQDTRDWSAALSASRTFFTWPASVGARFLQRTAGAAAPTPFEQARAVGLTSSIGWSGLESTPYGGIQRGVALSADAAWYPRLAGSSEELADVRGSGSVFLPLPPGLRSEFELSLVARAVPSERGKLLRVGGGGNVTGGTWSRGGRSAEDRTAGLVPGLAFTEYVRGYEDSTWNADAVAVGGARIQRSFIVDRGWASFLYVLPQFFIRQLDVEAFGTTARLDPTRSGGEWLNAAGAQAALRTQFGSLLPLSLVYQFAWRFRDDLGPLHVVGVALQ